MTRLVAALLLAMAAALTGVSPAVADGATVQDAQDRGDVMDLAEASHGHHPELARVLIHHLSTFEPWTSEDFIQAELRFWLRDGDPQPDRALVIIKNADSSLRGSMYKITGGEDCGMALGYCRYGAFGGFANVYRSDDLTLTAEFGRRLLARHLTVYRWRAFLTYPCSPPPNGECAPPPPDTHPGRVVHRL